ncbi:MAG: CPBP family intramembrane metalloprotease [Candidatus Izimaplasma sp.]|nr:CPBP family intramembrane metalloprotease [Candidatus Izimaplasma bacterium]
MQNDDLFYEDNPSSENDFQDIVNENKTNGIILIVYVVFTLIATLISAQLQISQEKNYSDLVQEDLSWQVVINEDEQYIIHYTGTVTNNTDRHFDNVYYRLEFYDYNDELFKQEYIVVEDLGIGDTVNIDEEYSPESEVLYINQTEIIPLTNTVIIGLNLISTIVVALLLFVVNKKNFYNNFIAFRNNPKKYFGYIIAGFVLVYASMIFANIILEYLGVSDTSQNEQTIQSLFTKNTLNIVMLFLLLTVFTPIVEETVFRKSIYGFIRPLIGDIGAIILSGLIFALMHVISYGDYIQIIPYAFMGLSFSYIYFLSGRNIYVVIAIHFLNNLIPFLIYSSNLV